MQGESRNRIRPAETDPDAAKRLMGQLRRFLESVHPIMGPHQANALARQSDRGHISAVLWVPASAVPTGLAFLRPAPTGLRVHGLYVDPPEPSTVRAFLQDIERSEGGPIGTVTDLLPGIPIEDQPAFFRPLGFWHRAKVLMRREGEPLNCTTPATDEIRTVRFADLPDLVGLYARSYAARPGEFWVWGSPDNRADAEDSISALLGEKGGWSPKFRPDASFVWEAGGRIVGAVLVDVGQRDVPFIDDLIVEPTFHRRGIGRSLLESALRQVTRDAPRPVELTAIRFGAPYRLYEKLGFREVPPPEGRADGDWVRGESPI